MIAIVRHPTKNVATSVKVNVSSDSGIRRKQANNAADKSTKLMPTPNIPRTVAFALNKAGPPRTCHQTNNKGANPIAPAKTPSATDTNMIASPLILRCRWDKIPLTLRSNVRILAECHNAKLPLLYQSPESRND